MHRSMENAFKVSPGQIMNSIKQNYIYGNTMLHVKFLKNINPHLDWGED